MVHTLHSIMYVYTSKKRKKKRKEMQEHKFYASLRFRLVLSLAHSFFRPLRRTEEMKRSEETKGKIMPVD